MPPDLNNPVTIFLTIMAVLLITPLLSERVHLPGIVGLLAGGMLVGPHGLGLLQAGSEMELLSTVGLLYLMFSAGLEVDIHQFNRVRSKALLFGVFTFLLPQLMGMALGRWLGMTWLGAVLLGSAFSSHTLIAFPILVRLGIVRNEAVSVTVGATVFTDIVAFVVLAVVISIQSGSLSAGYFIILFISLAVYALVILFGLPRLGKFFFRHFGRPAVEFQFVLVALFVAALLAEVIGVHSVVGAFLAGLAINATLPRHSPVVNRVLFLGESFFIPVFLVYSGLITDPTAFFTSRQTLLIGLAVTAVAYVSKFLAAWLAARVFGYTRGELLTVWGLSQAQAAVTIPTLVIGMQTGLFSETVFEAAILMILFTSITSPVLVERFGRRVRPAEGEPETPPLFDRVLVPVANPDTQEHLITLASILAHTTGGEMLVLNVAQEVNGHILGLDHQRQLLEKVPEIVGEEEGEVRLIGRVDTSLPRGILHAALETESTLLVLGWRGKPGVRESILGTVLDEVVWNATIPVLVGRITTPINAMQRLVLAVPQTGLGLGLARHTLELVTTMARAINVPLLVLANERVAELLSAELDRQHLEQPYQVAGLEGDVVRGILQRVTNQDLIVVTTIGNPQRFRSSLGWFPARLVAAHSGSIIFAHYPRRMKH